MEKLKEQIVNISKLLYDRGLVVATDGNVSARLSKDKILITPRGKCKGFLKSDEIVVIPLVGALRLRRTRPEGRERNPITSYQSPITGLKPSSEYKMHLEVYKQRKDVNAVIHTHSPFATAFSTTRKPLKPLLAETILMGGEIPCAKFATPSTDEVPKSISKWIKTHDSLLLANHGVLAIGKSLEEAFFQAERVEFLAKVNFLARILGGGKELSKKDIEELKRMIQS